jgi:phage gp36-like protein
MERLTAPTGHYLKAMNTTPPKTEDERMSSLLRSARAYEAEMEAMRNSHATLNPIPSDLAMRSRMATIQAAQDIMHRYAERIIAQLDKLPPEKQDGYRTDATQLIYAAQVISDLHLQHSGQIDIMQELMTRYSQMRNSIERYRGERQRLIDEVNNLREHINNLMQNEQ